MLGADLGSPPSGIRAPVLPTLVERRLAGEKAFERTLTFLPYLQRLLTRVDPFRLRLLEFVLVLPSPRGHIRLDDDVQRLVHVVEPDRRPAKRLLEVDVPAGQVPALLPNKEHGMSLSRQNQAKRIFAQ